MTLNKEHKFTVSKKRTSSNTLRYLFLVLLVNIVGCQKSNDSFSLLAEQSTFQQASTFQPRKIDILWVIDNSGSMQTSQTNLISNFNSFIQRFQTLNYDFQMAFTSTDAYLDAISGTTSHKNTYCKAFGNQCSVLRDGPGRDITTSLHSGFFTLNKLTPNISSVFNINATQGVQGYGDERAFLSFRTVLENTQNASLHRKDAFLAIIIISDEDDFSHGSISPALETLANDGYLTDSRIHKVSDYVNFLDTYTQSTSSTTKNYSVSSIAILDDACRDQLNTTFTGRRVGKRYIELSDATSGAKASLCGNFGESLELISNTVLTLSSVFKLDREPVPETIKVVVDGINVQNDAINGWTYDSSNVTVNFHGTSIPSADSQINITFDPVNVKAN